MKMIYVALLTLIAGSEVSQAADPNYQIISVRAAALNAEVAATVMVGQSAGRTYRCAFQFNSANIPTKQTCIVAGSSHSNSNDVSIFLGRAGGKATEVMPWDHFAMLDITRRVVHFCYEVAEIGANHSNEICDEAGLPTDTGHSQ